MLQNNNVNYISCNIKQDIWDEPNTNQSPSQNKNENNNKQVSLNDVNILNDNIIKENKAVVKGGQSASGIKYSAAELQFYKDHISGVQGF